MNDDDFESMHKFLDEVEDNYVSHDQLDILEKIRDALFRMESLLN